VSHRHLSDHLSELVENTLGDLEHSKVACQLLALCEICVNVLWSLPGVSFNEQLSDIVDDSFPLFSGNDSVLIFRNSGMKKTGKREPGNGNSIVYAN